MSSTEEINANKFARIQKPADLLTSSVGPMAQPTPCLATCVIKPNQAMNVILRALKAIANINPDGLSHKDGNYVHISKIEYVAGYSQQQMDLLYDHDIVFDERISARYKKNYRPAFQGMFEGHPVV